MIRSILLTLASLPLSAFAFAPAIELGCKGYDDGRDAAVEFNVLYADWDRGTGYSTQTVTVTKVGAVAVNEVYDLHELVLPGCAATDSVNKLSLINTSSGVWKAVYTRACGPNASYGVKATCEDL